MTGSYEGGWYPSASSLAHGSLISPSLLPHSSLSDPWAIERAGGVSERCEANREIRRSNGLLTAIRTELGRIFDRLGELFAAKIRQLRQRQARPEPAERPQERPQARETPPQAPQEPPKPIRTKKALTDRFKTRLDERLAENERKQAEKQAEPDMEETWDLSDPADPLNIGMGWGTGGHGLGL